VISDRATYAYVADVFVLEEARGRGVSKRIMECITSHPDLQDLRLWTLFTRDAHGLYRQSGFREARYPERLMEKRREPAAAGGARP
jgi:GNAT superfamily N-acetyltransferase